MTTRRGTRIVTGYVVSLSGKRGGPWLLKYGLPGVRYVTDDKLAATGQAKFAQRNRYPAARVLPVVRYELDREEERLRDAVVEAAMVAQEALAKVRDIAARQQAMADRGTYSDAISAEHDVAGPAYSKAYWALLEATRALRAHLEKSK